MILSFYLKKIKVKFEKIEFKFEAKLKPPKFSEKQILGLERSDFI